VALLLTTVAVTIAAQLGSAAPPELPDGTAEATRRIPTFKVPDGMKIELFAAEPKLASPVAIGLDERNRVFVAEEYRFNLGTEENRTRPFLLEDDLQIQTLDERQKMYEWTGFAKWPIRCGWLKIPMATAKPTARPPSLPALTEHSMAWRQG
jgi:hypothetical protein